MVNLVELANQASLHWCDSKLSTKARTRLQSICVCEDNCCFSSSGPKTLTNDQEETTVIITRKHDTSTVRKHIVEGVQIILLARQYRFTHK